MRPLSCKERRHGAARCLTTFFCGASTVGFIFFVGVFAYNLNFIVRNITLINETRDFTFHLPISCRENINVRGLCSPR